LTIKSITWNKESNELFDFESQDVLKNQFECRSAGSFIKRNEILKFIPANEKLPSDSKTKLICNLECDSKSFTLNRIAEESAALQSYVNRTDTPWIVVKSLKKAEVGSTNGLNYKLLPGDVIKLGRIKLKLMEVKLDSRLEDSVENQTKGFNSKVIENSTRNAQGNIIVDNLKENSNLIRKKRNNICRICYCDESEMESPLITPCSCSGTMRYIHFSCLQKWIKSKVVIKSTIGDNSMCYSLKQVECELCKTLLPGKFLKRNKFDLIFYFNFIQFFGNFFFNLYVKIFQKIFIKSINKFYLSPLDYIKCKDKVYELWDFKPKYKSYIVFETILTEKQTVRNIYVVSMESKQNIRIGRGHDSDIRVTDISVSRFHALIKKEKDGSFTLEDNNSKFGTLVLMQSPRLNILENQTLPVQIGRSYFTFDVKKPFSIFSCLCSSKKCTSNIDYQSLNAKYIFHDKCKNMKIMLDDDEEELESEAGLSIKQPLESLGQKINRSLIEAKLQLSMNHGNKSSEKPGLEIKNEVFFKVLENQEGNKEGQVPDDENAEHHSGSESSRRDINNFDVNENKIYFERANTNMEPTKIDMRAIREKLRQDLESLRRVDIS
jgi:hypothetical protein